MSDIDIINQQNPKITAIVNQDEYTIELQKYYSGHNENSKKLQWTNERIQSVMKLIDEYRTIKSQRRRPTSKHYHHAKKYDIISINKQRVLIVKRKAKSDPIVQIIPTENYYQKILDVHIATGHGRRDKIVNTLKDKYMIPIFAVSIFLNLCQTCLSKKSFQKKGVLEKPLITDDFNRRGLIDLVDFRTAPDREYKWLLQYEDNLTKFCFLRPLKSKQAKEVATEILKIFLEVGCPHILESDNGLKFTASVLKEIASLWPDCKILNGKHKYTQRQSSTDIKNKIQAWMTDNKSTHWSIGCYFVQFQKNSSYHSKIARTPHKALFGEDPLLGLPCQLFKNTKSKLENEEDLENLLKEFNNDKDQHTEENQEEIEQDNLSTIKISNICSLKIKQEPTEASNEIENNPEPSTSHENLPVIAEDVTHKPDNMQEKTYSDSINNINSENQKPTAPKRNYSVNKESINTKRKKTVHVISGVVTEETEGYESQLLSN